MLRSFFTRLVYAFKERSVRGTLQGFFLVLIFVPLLYLYLPVSYKLSYVNFTYGERGLDPSFKANLKIIFLTLFGAVYFGEVLLRGLLLRTLCEKLTWQRAFFVHLLLINLILIPVAFSLKWSFGMLGLGRGLLLENLLMSFWALFFIKTGSVLMTALGHSFELFLRGVIINDVAGSVETLYFYSAASDDFYWILIAATLFCVSLLVLMNQKLKQLELVRSMA